MRTIIAVSIAGALLAQPTQVPNLNGADPTAVDRTCKPCDDFYQFSMGAWHAKNPIPANLGSWGKSPAAAQENQLLLRRISEQEAAKGGLVGDFYASCMDTGSIDAAGVKPIQQHLQRISKIATTDQIGAEMTRLFQAGFPVVIAVSAAPHSEHPQQMVADLGVRGVLGLPNPEYYTRSDASAKATLDRYQELIRTLFRLADVPDTDVTKVLLLEHAFARAMHTNAERRNPRNVQYVSPKELEETVPPFDWKAHFAAVKAPLTGPVRVSEMRVLREFGRQLQETPIPVWRAYLTWKVLGFASSYLSEPFRKARFAFYREHLAGLKEEQPRWKECVQLADMLLGDALGKVYAKHLSPNVKQRVSEIFVNVRDTLDESLRELEWITPATKEQALKKTASLRPKIGYPDRWRMYEGDPMQRGSFFDNVQRGGRYRLLDNAERIGKLKDDSKWHMTVPTFNAYYDPRANEIAVPAGRLRPPMFSIDADDAANYGAIGAVIGHEIGHGFDDSGSQFDAEGRVRNWWTPEDRAQFLQRAQCVVDQFEGYFVTDGLHHNGKFVLGEATGDLSGLRLAYQAYRKTLKGKPEPKPIGGFSADQRFFLAYAQFRGNAERIEQQRAMILSDPHPTARYRVNGPLSNMPEFHLAFGCKRGDAMVRPVEKQCRIW